MTHHNHHVESRLCPHHGVSLIVQEQAFKTTDPDKPYYQRRLVCPYRFIDGCKYKEKFTDAVRIELDKSIEVEVEF